MALTKVGKEGITNISNSSDATAITIDSSENVGIGTTSPQVALHVEAASSSGKLRLSKGTVSSADDGVGSIQFRTGNTTAAANINGRTDASGTGNGAIQFSTGTTSSLNEAMRITSSGEVLIGTSTGGSSTCLNLTGTATLCKMKNESANGGALQTTINFGNSSGTTVGTIKVNNSETAFNTSSDYRLKQNIEDMTGSISRVKSLAPKQFEFIANPGKTVDGFLAHEAQAVVPGAVDGTKDEVDDDGNAVMQGIDHSKLVPLLTGALREAIAKIETLETKVAALEGS